MCDPVTLAALGMGGTAAATTAAGATAVAGAGSTLGLWMQGIGTVMAVGGNLAAARQAEQMGRLQAEQIATQQETERNLNAVKDSRRRAGFASQIAQQRAEIAARGVQLDSPTALALGETAAKEMSFESQAIRVAGTARDTELSAESRMARLRGIQGALSGRISAADSLLRAPVSLWRGFARGGAA